MRESLISSKTWSQLGRYAVVGVLSNGGCFLAYLVLTHNAVGPKTAMSVVYVAGVLITYLLNKRWTFEYQDRVGRSLISYASLYVVGYLLQITAIALLVDSFEWPHQWVVLGLVLSMPLFFFLGQKFIVFTEPVRN